MINPILDLLRSDGSIIINKKLAKAIGIDSTIVYSELVSRYYYFESRGQLTEDGFFFNTIEDLESGTCLTKYQQSKAIAILEKLELIKKDVRCMPSKRFFKILENEKIAEILIESQESKNLTSRSKKTSLSEVKKLDTNNTNLNNTNLNNTKDIKRDKGASVKDRYTMRSEYDNQDIVKSINYYMKNLYKQKTGNNHPNIKSEQYDNVYLEISSIVSKYNLDYENIIAMMVGFINDRNIKTDYNINHFATEGILENRFNEKIY